MRLFEGYAGVSKSRDDPHGVVARGAIGRCAANVNLHRRGGLSRRTDHVFKDATRARDRIGIQLDPYGLGRKRAEYDVGTEAVLPVTCIDADVPETQ